MKIKVTYLNSCGDEIMVIHNNVGDMKIENGYLCLYSEFGGYRKAVYVSFVSAVEVETSEDKENK